MAERDGAALSSLGRIIDYVFGRNALIGLASIMLLVISGYATWAGMHDFIVGASSAGRGRDLGGGISVSHDHLVVAVTIALTFLMWLALREAIGAERTILQRALTFPLYLFLVLWSVGFGYGFWWSLIAGEEATRTGLSSLQEEARDASAAIAARLDAVRVQVDSVATWSESQMAREEASGGSCGIPSGAGRGPLYNARRSVRDGVASLRDNINKAWLAPVQADLELLRKAAAGFEGATPEERQKQFEAAAAQIRGSARSVANRSNELGKSTAAEMRALANAVGVGPNQPGFTCHDPTLAQRLRQAADQAAEPAVINLRDVTFNEGPAGVANAVKNLWANLGSYLGSLLAYVVSGGRPPTGQAGGTPITGRDMIALLATIGIDLGIFVLALINRPMTPPIRFDALLRNQERLHRVDETVARELRAAFDSAIARSGADLEWVRHHFIHHANASYFVIPNLYRADRGNEAEQKKALAMNQLAGVMSDVKLIRYLGEKELKVLGKEEERSSLSALEAHRKAWRKEVGQAEPTGNAKDDKPIRNHGLLSKADRMLQIAGWSQGAAHDPEIYVLVDVEGLTPLLSILAGTGRESGAVRGTAAQPAGPEPVKA